MLRTLKLKYLGSRSNITKNIQTPVDFGKMCLGDKYTRGRVMCIIIPEFEQQNNKNMIEHGNKKMWVPVRTSIGN